MHHTRFSLLLIGVLVLSGCCRVREPWLRQNFEKNYAKLEELRRMSDQDPHLVRIASDFTRTDTAKWGISEERWNQYRRLFEEAHVSGGLDRNHDGVTLTAQACGLSVSGLTSGYVYSPTPPQPLVSHFDDFHGPTGIAYVPLRDHWYLFVWYS